MKMGRRAIYRPKDKPGGRVTGYLTKTGKRAFEGARRRLAAREGVKPEDVSDADTTEYLALGEDKQK